MNLETKKKLIDVVALSFISVWLLGFIIFLGMIITNNYTITYIIAIFLSLALFPYYYINRTRKYLNIDLVNYIVYFKRYIFLGIVINLWVNYLWGNVSISEFATINIKYITVAVSEEILYRYYIQKILEEKYSIAVATFIQICLFSFVLHSGFSFLDNLIIRFPSGIVLTWIFKKTNNLSIPITIHFLYDSVIHIIYL
ncbi:CPBP family intramembrane glutamic endopeptidase [Ligilactobacillus animalis]|jgi:membrane protease YdiL (CAAX protease family)|uniref:CPBP family intramembrane glutamic endopeptidase n=1 Tax=Ligilactobacillus animalis TaxID=1605 RepID=UPI002593F66D|nr:type II CAAX endopeptidase family protein [Ligilactobacillus animalis]